MTTPASAIEQSLRPVAVDERIDLVDVVRGFALYGVLLANLVWITTDVVLTESHMAALPTAALDRIVKPLILLGLYVGRRNWAQRTAELVPSLRRVLPWSIAIAVTGNGAALVIDRLQHDGVIGPDSYWMHLRAPVWEAGVLAMAFVYLAILVFLFHSGSAWRDRLGYLAPVGRMALTNYLTHSVLYLALFTGVGLGLYGEVGPALCVVLSIAIFTAQMAFSRWWLARYRFGPAEWVWRTLTYGQGQPMTLIGK